MKYSQSSFDEKALSFNCENTKWITIEENSKVFQLLMSYIPSHIVENTKSSESYTIQVLPAQSKEKEASVIGTPIHGRISLNSGILNRLAFKFQDFHQITL